jgi:3-hydroxy-9,10-secoandrosta-1,3,5(10)-triene-9,17-dione monooxygenase reductase component
MRGAKIVLNPADLYDGSVMTRRLQVYAGGQALEHGPAASGANGRPFEERDFRNALGQFASGVVVVTGTTPKGPAGLTCQSFFSLSLDPPLVAVALGKSSTSWPSIGASGAFCANILATDQEDLCVSFARSGNNKFYGVSWSAATTGSPRLDSALAWVDCEIEAIHEAGDHYLVVGAIVDLGARPGDPLVFHAGQFVRLDRERRSGGRPYRVENQYQPIGVPWPGDRAD